MLTRIFIVVATLSLVSGCVVAPRFEITQRIDFDRLPANMQPMGYDDVMCCVRCTA